MMVVGMVQYSSEYSPPPSHAEMSSLWKLANRLRPWSRSRRDPVRKTSS